MFTIVIPTYNGARFIRDALQSLVPHRRLVDNVIISDDASEDNTVDICRDWLESNFFKYEVISSSTNSGSPTNPINSALPRVNSEYLIVLDQDDVLAPSSLEHIYQLVTRNSHPDIIIHLCSPYSDATRVWQVPEIVQQIASKFCSEADCSVFNKGELIPLILEHGNIAIGFPGMCFRTEKLKSRGGIPRSLRVAGDFELLAWFAMNSAVYISNKTGYFRREHGYNLSTRNPRSLSEAALIVANIVIKERRSLTSGQLHAIRNQLEGNAYSLRRQGHLLDALSTYMSSYRVHKNQYWIVRDYFKSIVYSPFYIGLRLIRKAP